MHTHVCVHACMYVSTNIGVSLYLSHFRSLHQSWLREDRDSIPLDKTMTMSLSVTVGTRWAIVMTVQLENSSLITL